MNKYSLTLALSVLMIGTTLAAAEDQKVPVPSAQQNVAPPITPHDPPAATPATKDNRIPAVRDKDQKDANPMDGRD
jgi:hypothetical protein